MVDLLGQTVLSATSYFFFNVAIFRFVGHQTGKKAWGWLTYGVFLLVNFTAFGLFGAFELNLVVSWALILFMFLFEVRVAYRIPWGHALCYALIGVAVGLAFNIFWRSLFAIVLDLPQSQFDSNSFGKMENLKFLPISMGFAFSAVAFFLLDRLQAKREVLVVCENKSSLSFFLVMSLCAFGYLCSVLLLYSMSDNALVLKLWGMKASVSAGLIFGLSFYFAYRSAYLIKCGEESRRLSEAVVERRKANELLHSLAIRDSLTGCYTRSYLEERLVRQLAESEDPFGVVFVDLDRLKKVNDTYGHDAGNEYLSTVTGILLDFCHEGDGDYLCRYGGDEFVGVCSTLDVESARKRMEEVAHRLRTENESGRFPYTLSISYGVVAAQPGEDYSQVLARADAEMYRNKKHSRDTEVG